MPYQRVILILSKEPIKISKNITFLGEIPKMNDFEKRKPIGKQMNDKVPEDNFVFDDTALVYKSDNGIYIIAGCSQ